MLANDTDADPNTTLTAALVSNTTHGSVNLSSDGSFTYTPNSGYTGSDTFTYQANDGTANSNSATVTIDVSAPPNSPPVANDDTYSTTRDTTLNTAAPGVLTNDTDVDPNTTLTAALVSTPTHGTVNLSSDGSFNYTPNSGYTGSDIFTYQANDGTANSNTVTVTINVSAPPNSPPVANDDTYSITKNTTLNVTALQGVLANDIDIDPNTTITAALVSTPTHGTVNLSSDGSFNYTPNSGYTGSDTFTYRANDGTANSNTATVTINVTALPNTPPIAVNDAYSATKNTILTEAAPGVLGNDTDIDGNPLTAKIVADPLHGTVELNANGSFSYTPNSGYTGSDTFTYQANDGTANSNTATVTINVTAPPNSPPVANDDTYSITKDTLLTVTVPGVLGNDKDADNNILTASLVSNATHGTVNLSSDGSFSYTPNSGYTGTDTFTYRANDGTANSNTATVTINIIAKNKTPSFTKGNDLTVDEDSGAQTVVNWATNISPGGADEQSQTLHFVIDSNNNPGLFAAGPVISALGTLTYTPASNASGLATITITLHDDGGTANGGSDTSPSQTFTITVNSVNDPPVATADDYTTNQNTPLATAAPGVLANDTDVDTSILTAILVDKPVHGTINLNSDGSFSYTPNTDYNGVDTFSYKVSDGISTSNTVIVTITIRATSNNNNTAPPSINLPPGTTDITQFVNSDGLFQQKVEAKSDDGKTIVVIEPGTTAKTDGGAAHGQITINKILIPENIKKGLNNIIEGYECEPTGATFDPAVTITFIYDPAQLPSGVDESTLAIGYYDEKLQSWVKLTSTVNTLMHTVSAQVGHFSLFTIIGEPVTAPTTPVTALPAEPTIVAPSSLILNSINFTPSEVSVGELFVLSFMAKNTGETAGTFKIELRIDDEVVDTKNVFLEAGSTEQVSFEIIQNTPGLHVIAVNEIESIINVKPLLAVNSGSRSQLPLIVLSSSLFFTSYVITVIIAWQQRKREM